jgi:hypothetical protein
MKKLAYFMAFVLMLGVCLINYGGTVAYAKPAPQLSSMQVEAVWDDENNYSTVSTSYPYSVNSNITFRGKNLYLLTKFVGYPNWATVFYRDNTSNGRAFKCTTIQRDMIGNPATGWYQTVAIPISEFSGSYQNICVTAFSANGGGSKYTRVSNIHVQK